MRAVLSRLVERRGPLRFETYERDQALIRLVISSAILAYSSYFLTMRGLDVWVHLTFLIPLSFLAFSLAMTVWAWRLWKSKATEGERLVHRFIGICGDIGVLSWGLAATQELGAPWFPVYLWVILGNGIRYGVPYLQFATLASLVGFASVIFHNPYWGEEQLALAIGLLVGLIVLPLYVGGLINRLNRALAASDQANRAKAQFIANISHELRTPLNGVIAVTDLMREKPLDHELLNMVSMIESSAKAQLQLINQILDVSKIDAGHVSIVEEPFDLLHLIQDVDDMVRPQARNKGLAMFTYVDTRIPAALRGSGDYLRQVLVNLVGNAAKFTNEGHIALRVYAVACDEERAELRFEIADTGIGIPQTAVHRIFDAFAQVDESNTRRFGGTGLGTTISRQLVSLMGGDIELRSVEGVGTTFEVRLSLARDPGSPVDPGAPGEDVHFVGVGFEPFEPWLAAIVPGGRVSAETVPTLESLLAREPRATFEVVLVNAGVLGAHGAAFMARAARELPQERAWLVALDPDDETAVINAGAAAVLRSDELAQGLGALLARTRVYRRGGPRRPLAARPTRKLNVLLAEDHETNQKVGRMILESEGHRVSIVENGELALEKLLGHSFDVAILDMHMPVMTGTDAARMYRFATPDASTPIILLSADITEDARRQAEQAGIDRRLSKPVSKADLLNAVYELVGVERVAPGPSRELDNGVLLDESTLDDLMNLASDGVAFMDDLLRSFLDEGATNVGNALTSARRAQLRGFLDALHAIKGSSLQLGLGALTELSTRLRTAHRDGFDESRLSSDLDELQRVFAETRGAVDRYLRTLALH